MPLIPRVKVRGDVEHASLVAPLERLALIAERLTGDPNGWNIIAPDTRDAEGLFDAIQAHLRRESPSIPLSVHRHNCPHVPGFEEPTHGACTNAEYAFEEEAI